MSESLDEFFADAASTLSSGNTKARISTLHSIKAQLQSVTLSPPQAATAAKFLLQTCSRYSDPQSITPALECVSLLISQDIKGGGKIGKLGEGMAKWVDLENSKLANTGFSAATSSLLNTIQWTLCILSASASSQEFGQSASWPVLLKCLAQQFDAILGSSGRRSMKHSAEIQAWRLFRQHHHLIPSALAILSSTKNASTNKDPLQSLVLLGTLISVEFRLNQKPKHAKEPLRYVEQHKNSIQEYFATHVLVSRTSLAPHRQNALQEYWRHYLTESDLASWSELGAAVDKSLLRSPDVALPVVASFITDLNSSIPFASIASSFASKALSQLTSTSKSSNPKTRSGSVELFVAVLKRSQTSSNTIDNHIKPIIGEAILTPLKTGKTASADHRVVLLSILDQMPVTIEYSPHIISCIATFIPKEGAELVSAAAFPVLSKHVTGLLKAGHALDAKDAKALVACTTEGKPANKRGALEMFGQIAFDTADPNEKLVEFLKSLAIPVFEGVLKAPNASNTDNWIAIASLRTLSAKASLKSTNAAATKAIEVHGILQASVKGTGILSEKNYKKLVGTSAEDDEVWFFRCVASLSLSLPEVLTADAASKNAFILPLYSIAVQSAHYSHRKEASALVASMLANTPDQHSALALNEMLIEGLLAYLPILAVQKAVETAAEDAKVIDYSARLRGLLASFVAWPQGEVGCVNDETKELSICRLLLLAHHPDITTPSSSLWIDLILSTSLRPETVVKVHSQGLLASIYASTSSSTADSKLATAAFDAVATLLTIDSASVTPLLVQSLERDLDPTSLSAVSAENELIWQGTEGELVIDVLAQQKPQAAVTKSKNRADEQWDAEMRAALAKKKAANGINGSAKKAPTNKAEKSLVDAQLAKESAIRKSVSDAVNGCLRGFGVVKSILSAHHRLLLRQSDDGLLAHLPAVIALMVEIAKAPGSRLISQQSFETFLLFESIVTDRISEMRLPLLLAVLRSYDACIVPEDYAIENVADLILRVLYRLRFQSDLRPLDPATYALCSPLLGRCVVKGGIGLPRDAAEELLEQMALCVDIVRFHCRECSNSLYPRLQMIADLLAALKAHPSLAKTASDALADLGAAMESNASEGEIQAILSGAMVEEAHVRRACLSAVERLDLTEMTWSPELWLLCHDNDDHNRELAISVWEDNGLDVPENFLPQLLPFLDSSVRFARIACANSIAEAVSMHEDEAESVVDELIKRYTLKAKPLSVEYDQYGMVIESTMNQEDPWRSRVAYAGTIEAMAKFLETPQVLACFSLFIKGEGLGDQSQAVRSRMLAAGVAIIDSKGKDNVQALMKMFETYLAAFTPPTETHDRIKESVIVLFGRLAGYLEPKDPRIKGVIQRLVEALKTPSELVQSAISDCLPPLVRDDKEEGVRLTDDLMRDALHAAKYAERRGAAYGLAGVIRGRGIMALKGSGVISRLQDALEDKKNPQARQGALFALETLSGNLGRLFEPYIIKLLPSLLSAFGDGSTDVREAASDASKVVMSKVSGHAVKLILPSLLEAVEDRQWRTKKGAIELMGNMAFLAPQQLSQSLPNIIPRLTDVITDTHAQVRASANSSLKRFGEVVSNPEIQAMQDVLLNALVEPSKKTTTALDVLLATSFVHYIDASSLALVVPILDRGLRERSAETKRKSARIIGNMASITESKDLLPYLPQLVPKVQEVLVDPVPEARSTAAKALGVLIERLGESAFPTLVDELMDTLHSEASGVDQQGAAQGLSEVLAGLGVQRLEDMLPDIINKTRSPKSYVREGFVSLLIYLPSVFGERFSPYLGRIISPVLNGLADESEFVRESAMKAGRMIVANHSSKATDLLLPELEKTLFDAGWRIRHSSITLVSELLFRISGISGKTDVEEEGNEEEDISNEAARKALLEVLGKDRRDRILSAIYILRQDAVGQVRLAAIHLWKIFVSNTPSALREILTTLMQIIIRTLTTEGEDQREMGAKTLGELCRKMGERITSQIIATLEKASHADVMTRRGVQQAMVEVLQNTSKTQLEEQESALIAIVRTALVDEDATVRREAAQAFDALQQAIGARSIDETIPTLLAALQQPGGNSEAALSALKELMHVRAQTIFPTLIPTLIKKPISAFNAKALASLVTVAGSALNKRLTNIIDNLSATIDQESDESVKDELSNALSAVLASVKDSEGLYVLMQHLLTMSKSAKSASQRVTGCKLFKNWCQVKSIDFDNYIVDWLRQLISLFDDPVEDVVEAAWSALEALGKVVPKEDMEALVPSVRRSIENTGAPHQDLPGFSRPNGLKPILPFLLQGLLAGTAEQRAEAAAGLGDVVLRTSPDHLKAFVTQITGPLIRIIAERFPPPVKSAILSSLAILLEKVPMFVRPFFPQLQRTFIKNLADPASITVRNHAASALGILMRHQPRIDPLVTELLNGIRSEEAPEVIDSFTHGLANIVTSGAKNMGAPAKESIVELLNEKLSEVQTRENFAKALARLVTALLDTEPSLTEPILLNHITSLEAPQSQQVSLCIRECLETTPEHLYTHSGTSPADVTMRILRLIASGQPDVARPARDAKALLKDKEPWSYDTQVQSKLE